MARGSSVAFPLTGPDPLGCRAGGAAGLRSAAGRCRGPALVLAPVQPDDAGWWGHAGAD